MYSYLWDTTLEVKGDFCHDVRRILEKAGRGDDYLEI